MTEWKVTKLPKAVPVGRDENGHPLKAKVGSKKHRQQKLKNMKQKRQRR